MLKYGAKPLSYYMNTEPSRLLLQLNNNDEEPLVEDDKEELSEER